MFEESVDSFTSRWQADAASVTVFSRTENDPLLEIEAGGVILHALERTGPYLPKVGSNRVIVHALCESVEQCGEQHAHVEITGISRMKVTAAVIRNEAPFLVVDAGFPLVVGVLHELPPLSAGDTVSFVALPPLHAFVLPEAVKRRHDSDL